MPQPVPERPAPTGRPASHRLVVSDADAGDRLDHFVAARLPELSRSQVQRLIRSGHVHLSRGRLKASLPVEPGLVVEVELPPAEPAVPAAEALPLAILYDDEDLVVVDKPAGMVVHPGAGHRGGTLVNALLHHVSGLSGIGGTERPGIVHRLDRDTSGLLVVAKHDQAHRHLTRQFQERRVEKTYTALVWGQPDRVARYQQPIGRDPRHRQRMSTRAPRGRPAVTQVVDVEPFGSVSLVRLTIETGRTHQIRVHLAAAGHPIVGDAVYGGARRPGVGIGDARRMFLHATRLSFVHPTRGERLVFEAPLPPAFTTAIEQLRRSTGPPRRTDVETD